jgi:hypothetical protein
MRTRVFWGRFDHEEQAIQAYDKALGVVKRGLQKRWSAGKTLEKVKATKPKPKKA